MPFVGFAEESDNNYNFLQSMAEKHIESCKESYQGFKTAKKDFQKACIPFSKSGIADCQEILETCNRCPSEDSEGGNCLKFHNEKICPQLSGTYLKQAEKDIETLQGRQETLEEDIADLKGQIQEKQNELTEISNDFTENEAQLKTAFEEAKQELDKSVKQQSEEIDESTEENIAQIQESLEKSLSTHHKFINLTSEASKKYREGKMKAYLICRQMALKNLSDYRQQRRTGIVKGTYKKSSVLNILNRNRVSFAQTDHTIFNKDYKSCLNTRGKLQMQLAKEEYQETLKQIDQAKKEYSQELRSLGKKVGQLKLKAAKQQDKLLKQYSSDLNAGLRKFVTEDTALKHNFVKNQRRLELQMAQLQEDLQRKEALLQEAGRAHRFNRQMSAQLRSKNVKDDDDLETHFSEASTAKDVKQEQAEEIIERCCEKGTQVSGINGSYNRFENNENAYKNDIFGKELKSLHTSLDSEASNYCKKATKAIQSSERDIEDSTDPNNSTNKNI